MSRVYAVESPSGEARARLYFQGGAFPEFSDETLQQIWLSKDAEIRVEIEAPPESCVELGFSIETGSTELYDHFPFLAALYCDGTAQEYVEFSAPFERQKAKLSIRTSACTLRFRADLGSVPETINLSKDERELAIRIVGIEVSVRAGDMTKEQEPLSSDPTGPIFVIGAYRSGTSVLTWALGQHPNIWPLEETGWLAPIVYGAIAAEQLGRRAKRSYFDVYDVSSEQFLTSFGTCISSLHQAQAQRNAMRVLLQRVSEKAPRFHPNFNYLRALDSPKGRWVDGTPENTFLVTSLLKLFPNARFVFCVRPPIDVIASLTMHEVSGIGTPTAEQAAAFYKRLVNAGLMALSAFGPKIVKLVPYERLVSAPEDELLDVFRFLNEPNFTPAARTFDTRINSSRVTDEHRTSITRVAKDCSWLPQAETLYQRCVELSLFEPAFARQQLDEMAQAHVASVLAALTSPPSHE